MPIGIVGMNQTDPDFLAVVFTLALLVRDIPLDSFGFPLFPFFFGFRGSNILRRIFVLLRIQVCDLLFPCEPANRTF